jgi:hypothetical protein
LSTEAPPGSRRRFLIGGGSMLLMPGAVDAAVRKRRRGNILHAARRFEIFDALFYPRKPDMGFSRIRLIDRDFWRSPDRAAFDHKAIQRQALEAAKQTECLVIDVENWKVDAVRDGPSLADASMKRFIAALAAIRAVAPQLKLSIYAIPPLTNYWAPVSGERMEIENWQRANRFLAPLANALDFICPSLYTFYDNVAGWQTFARANLAEARRYGKPVVPFIWPRYHESVPQHPNYVDGAYWRTQLETIRREGADGVILWDWDGFSNPRTGNLDPSLGWWQETERFARDLGWVRRDGAKTPAGAG